MLDKDNQFVRKYTSIISGNFDYENILNDYFINKEMRSIKINNDTQSICFTNQNGMISIYNPETRKLDVTGFNFAGNFVSDTGRDEDDYLADKTLNPGTFYGRKLVITFDVKANNFFLGGNGVITNDSAVVNNKNDETVGTFAKFVMNMQHHVNQLLKMWILTGQINISTEQMQLILIHCLKMQQ